MKALFLSVFLALCFWQGAAAREFTASEKADLHAQIERLETTLKQIALTSVKFLDFKLDIDNATYNEAPDGTAYVLVPSRSLMESQGQKIEVKSTALALMEEGKWYLPRIDDSQQINLLREVYPFVTTIEFPTRTMTPVE